MNSYTSQESRPLVLLVDDSPSGLQMLSHSLSKAGFILAEALSGEEALAFFPQLSPDIVLLDIMMPGMDGMAQPRAARESDPDLVSIMMTGAGTVLMFAGGLIMTGTLALLPTMLQNLMNYPVMTTGLVCVPRGIGSMAAMFIVAPLINRVDNRLIILFGFLLTAVSMWQMSQFSLQMGMAPVIISGFLQGFGLGCTQVPLNIIALSTLPRHILTQGTAIRSLMRNLGGSVGISVLVAILAQNTQVVHSRLVEGLRPDNPLAQAPYLAAPFSLTTPSGMAALNAEVTRQAAMVAYVDDFKLLMLIALASLPLLLLLREARRRPPPVATAAADD